PLDWTRPLPRTPPGGLAEPGYVGAAACQPCHAKIYASYARHSMARTGLRPLASLDARWLARIFDAGAKTPLHHPKSGSFYRPFRRGDHYFIEEYRLAQDGTRIASRVQPITDSLSAGSYGLAFYFRQGSRIYHAPIDYYARLDRWDFDPIAFGGDPHFSASLGTFCISCHSDYPRRLAGSRKVFFAPMAAGIGCERCHGPGARHVESMDPKDIVNPAHLPPLRQLDLCTQCHQSSFPVLRAGSNDFSYRPGQPLDDFRVDFINPAAPPDRFNLLAHSERLVRSACFRESQKKLTCTSCHDPHVSSLDEPVSYWDQKCEACHRDHPCTAPEAARASEGDHCPRCHMRAGQTANVPLVTVTDHFIQRRPPQVRPGPLPPPARLETWSALVGDPVKGSDLVATRAVASAQAGRGAEAERLAATPVAARARVPELYEWLARRERQTPLIARRTWATLLGFDPDSAEGLVGYARATLEVGAPDAFSEAMHALDRLLAIDPENPEALETKGVLLFRRGQTEAARPLFERCAAAGPASASCSVGLAALALRDHRAQDAASALEAARRSEPTDAWILAKLSEAYGALHDRGHLDEIERVRTALLAGPQRPSITSATRWLPPSWR
ncbi:MAG: multiheme c-type cytochrome, partial [Polyangia bacterium]